MLLNTDTVDLFLMSIRWPVWEEAEGALVLKLTLPLACQVTSPRLAPQLHNLDLCFLSKILTKCHARFRQEHLLQPGLDLRPTLSQTLSLSLTDGFFQGCLKFLTVATLCLWTRLDLVSTQKVDNCEE